LDNPTPSASLISILDFGLRQQKNRYAERGERSDNHADDDVGQIMRGDGRTLARMRSAPEIVRPKSATSATTGISRSAAALQRDGGCLFCLHSRSKEDIALRSDLLSSIEKFNTLVLTRIGAIRSNFWYQIDLDLTSKS
jgi:hypothetical protein